MFGLLFEGEFLQKLLWAIGVENRVVERYADLLNCRILSWPFVYLGIPIEANPRKLNLWQPIFDKFSKKLTLWKHKFMFLAGRSCLVNSVLSSYLFSFFRNQNVVTKIQVGIQRRLLWGGGNENKKIAWVKWGDICKE